MFLWGTGTILLGGFLLWLLSIGALDEFAFVQRFYDKSTAIDSSLEGRGYLAFLQANSAQLLFGLGTQNVHRIVGPFFYSIQIFFFGGGWVEL